jgi:hypothetical protein
MILVNLKIESCIDGEIIRNVNFNKSGLSLIVDETNSEASGSNIGKTTFVKIIDLCFGAKSISSIYKEKDTGENTKVKSFLEERKIEATLTIEVDNSRYLLKRPLFKNGKPKINDQEYSNNENYCSDLVKIVFPNANDLTLRQLITKFIRLDNSNEDALFKYLPGFPRNYLYQAIYDYLFGIISNKSNSVKASDRKIAIQKDIEAIFRKNGVKNMDELQAKVSLLSDKIKLLEANVDETVVAADFEIKEKEYNNLLASISSLEADKTRIEIITHEIVSQIHDEEGSVSNIDHLHLLNLYEETKTAIGELHIKFKDFENFHNSMIKKRIELLNSVLIEYNEKLLLIGRDLNELREIFEKGYKSFSYEVRISFQEKYGELTESKKVYSGLVFDHDYIFRLQEEIGRIDFSTTGINDVSELRKEAENKFNMFFKEETNKVIGESYALVFGIEKEDSFPLSIVGLMGKPGTGVKKALIYCFDSSHVQYIISEGIRNPHFIIHDKMENVSIPEMKGVMKSASIFEGQYILPILSDRISTFQLDPSFEILRLSKTNKFFRI